MPRQQIASPRIGKPGGHLAHANASATVPD